MIGLYFSGRALLLVDGSTDRSLFVGWALEVRGGVRLTLSIVENRGNGEVEGRKKVIECNRYDIQNRVEYKNNGKGRNGKLEGKGRKYTPSNAHHGRTQSSDISPDTTI